MAPRLKAVTAAGLLLAATTAGAHVRLVSPTSRYGDEMKFGPCGRPGGVRSANVTTLAPGQTITVVFDELIGHPGYYRIAFDADGDTDLAPPTYDAATMDWSNPAQVLVLVDRIADPAVGLMHGEIEVTLPDVECATCTLQLIQVMTDKPPYDGLDDFYYQCADLFLTLTPGTGPPPTPAPPPAAPPAAPYGGCATGAGPAGALALLALLALPAARRLGGRSRRR